jgi:hypothetical protein
MHRASALLSARALAMYSGMRCHSIRSLLEDIWLSIIGMIES